MFRFAQPLAGPLEEAPLWGLWRKMRASGGIYVAIIIPSRQPAHLSWMSLHVLLWSLKVGASKTHLLLSVP